MGNDGGSLLRKFVNKRQLRPKASSRNKPDINAAHYKKYFNILIIIFLKKNYILKC